MMIERSPDIEKVSQMLDQAADKLTKMSKKQVDSKQELNELIKVLSQCNSTFNTKPLEDKKLALEEMNESIEKALLAIQLFQRGNKIIPKNVEQAIISLFSKLADEIDIFNKNLRDLKKYKIGHKVEKTSESKHS